MALTAKQKEWATLIQRKAQELGYPYPDFAVRVAFQESSLDPKKRNGNRVGFGQVGEDALQDLGISKEAYDSSPEVQAEAMIRYMHLVEQGLTARLGREPALSDIYTGYMFGTAGADPILAAQPNAAIRSVVSDAALKANPWLAQIADQPVSVLRGKHTEVASRELPGVLPAAALPRPAPSPLVPLSPPVTNPDELFQLPNGVSVPNVPPEEQALVLGMLPKDLGNMPFTNEPIEHALFKTYQQGDDTTYTTPDFQRTPVEKLTGVTSPNIGGDRLAQLNKHLGDLFDVVG